MDDARRQIRRVMKHASEGKSPKVSREAKRLLQGYYTYVRNPQDFNEQIHARSVPVSVFQSLLRLASASARLALSPTVRAVPDVTLAIKLTEETLLEAVRTTPI